MVEIDPRSAEIAAFWREAGPDKWFSKDDGFDDTFRQRFQESHFAASRRELDQWASRPEGSFALMILLDQFPRNCFRGSGHMYATDGLARHHARAAIEVGHDQAVEQAVRSFFYLPLMHSEDIADQNISVERCTPIGGETLKYAHHHREIIERFGRFPHRNRILGREITAEEQVFLDAGGFAG